MLENIGYEDSEYKEYCNNNVLHTLLNKHVIKKKSKVRPTVPHNLKVYESPKLKFGTPYAQKWSKN